eukprot:jgi/Ulvmu1/7383/UM036_0043.1
MTWQTESRRQTLCNTKHQYSNMRQLAASRHNLSFQDAGCAQCGEYCTGFYSNMQHVPPQHHIADDSGEDVEMSARSASGQSSAPTCHAKYASAAIILLLMCLLHRTFLHAMHRDAATGASCQTKVAQQLFRSTNVSTAVAPQQLEEE